MAFVGDFESAGTATARTTSGTARTCGSESIDSPAGSAKCTTVPSGTASTVHACVCASRMHQDEHHNIYSTDSV